MRIDIAEFCYIVTDADGGSHLTRPCVLGGVATHRLPNTYSADKIAQYIKDKVLQRKRVPFIQDEFPLYSSEDREFILTGITPEHWNKLFPPEER